jgi:hypothetical protein
MPDSRISAFSLVGTPSTSTELVANEPGAGTRRLTLGQAMAFLQTARGMPYVKGLAATVNSTSVTPAKVTGLDLNPGAGTFIFEYYLRWQAATATTGIKLDCNHNGTVTSFVWQQRYVDTSATASTAVPDQDAVGAAAQVQGAFASRAKGTAGRGVLLSADTAAADMLTIIEGIAVVTVAGNFELWHGAEVAAAGNVSVMVGSALRLTQVA